jgi:hypothetical protein
MSAVEAEEKKIQAEVDAATKWKRLPESRIATLEGMLFNERFCDVTLRCVGESGESLKDFRVARTLMASASEHFREQMFDKEKGKARARDEIIDVSDAKPEYLECLIRYAYFIDPHIDRFNAMPVRELALKYKVAGLTTYCESLLSEKSLNPDTYCEMLSAAVQYNLRSLLVSCVKAIEETFRSKEFQELFASDGFLRMPRNVLIELLRSDRLRIKEEELFTKLQAWSTKQAELVAEMESKSDGGFETKDEFMGSVKDLIRFPVMKPEFLLKEVMDSGMLSRDEIYDIMRSRLLKKRLTPYSMTRRKGNYAFEDSIQFTRGQPGSSWGYSGGADGICVQFDTECALVGIGTWLPVAGARMFLRIFEGNNGSGHTHIKEYAEQTLNVGRQNEEPEPYRFEEPFIVKPDTKYTLELHQTNISGSSRSTSTAHVQTITHEGVTVSISGANHSPNSTSTTGGAFPCFYICV